ncbi:class I SAM-dependent methyltransferase [Patescibacteria group bacterium]|nr:class I SAM-dependent methyltransferase [Patescibacteria group bacterium]
MARISQKTKKKLIKAFFKEYPPAHAIFRVNEALALKRAGLIKPVLDLGCGDGRFAQLVFGLDQIEVGLDPDQKEIKRAQELGVYEKTRTVPGSRIPYPDGYFSTVVSNSVLEHILDLELVLAEVERVLKPGGRFLLTVPLAKVWTSQFYSWFIPGYAKFKNWVWKHHNLLTVVQWKKLLAKHGLGVVEFERVNSVRLARWGDLIVPIFLLGPIPWLGWVFARWGFFHRTKDGVAAFISAQKEK